MKATAERIRAAGLKPGTHTLTACISPNDPWVTPAPSPHLIASNRYTLAKPLPATDKTIFVNEAPGPGHDVIWSYSGNGNALRVGSESIRYLANPSLELGGSKVVFPVTLQSGQYIELEGIDDCVLYDERGELLSRFRPQVEKLPLLAEGANAIRFGCTPPQGQSARAEITVVSLGQPFGGRRPDAEIDWKRLDREYDIPRIVTRFDGADNVWNIVRRSDAPGGQEKPPVLEVELAIPQLAKPEKQAGAKESGAFLAEPVLAIGEQSVRFPVRLTAGQRLICRDQATWRVLSADGAEVAAGQVAGTFPTLLPGANRVTLASQAKPAADFRVIVKAVKVYR